MSQNPSSVSRFLSQVHLQRNLVFGVIIMSALLAFETFNYSTTEYALTDLLGDMRFAGLHWATILSIAFCGIDFAGIARLFTPSQSPQAGTPGSHETWYLFGAWLLAASMNAMLTWWGVSLAVLGHETLGNAMLGRTTLLRVVPIFVALMVWLIRILIIGTYSVAGEDLFSQRAPSNNPHYRPARPGYSNKPVLPLNSAQAKSNRAMSASGSSYARQPLPPSRPDAAEQPEPTYHPLSAMTTRIDQISERQHNSSPSRRF